MAGYWYTLGLVAVLVVLNALLAGSEVALVSLRQEQLRLLEQRGGRRERLLVRLARDPNRFLATIQIGITLAGFLASATAAVSLAQPLARPLGFLGAAAEPVAVGLVTLVLTFITLVLGELAPKRLAMQYAQQWSLLAAKPLHWLSVVSRPVVWLLGKATSLVVRVFGGDPTAGREELTLDELRHAVAGSQSLTPEQRAIVTGALDLRRRTLREVQVPRGSVFTLTADVPAPRARPHWRPRGIPVHPWSVAATSMTWSVWSACASWSAGTTRMSRARRGPPRCCPVWRWWATRCCECRPSANRSPLSSTSTVR